jgi:ribosome-binding protein aMBF1 (putative translation factor)
MRGRFLVSSNKDRAKGNFYADKSSLVLNWLLQEGLSIESFSLREVAEETEVSQRKNALQQTFGQIVRERRLSLGISQEKLAERAGLHFTYVSSTERGERNISLVNIAKLAKGLGCSIKDLMP